MASSASLLRLARLEGGSEGLEGDPIPLKRVVQEVAADADFEAQARNRHVRVPSATNARFSETGNFLPAPSKT